MDWPVALQPQPFRNFPLAHPALQHPLDFWQKLLHFLISSPQYKFPPVVVPFSYIRGDLSIVRFFWRGSKGRGALLKPDINLVELSLL